jgi:hypothetical protein
VVLVAKHNDGCCLWPAEQKNYSVKNSQWESGRDRLPPVTTARVRLNILESSAQPHVRHFQVFSIGKTESGMRGTNRARVPLASHSGD